MIHFHQHTPEIQSKLLTLADAAVRSMSGSTLAAMVQVATHNITRNPELAPFVTGFNADAVEHYVREAIYRWREELNRFDRQRELIAQIKPTVAERLGDAFPQMSADELKLRVMLANAYSGNDLYRDDGELQDTSRKPHIDFRRDPVDLISAKLTERGKQWELENALEIERIMSQHGDR